MSKVEHPAMRAEVMAALRSLADSHHQETRWGVIESGSRYYDDLSLNVHILYDDCQVLPEPLVAVGVVVAAGEVDALRALHEALGPLLEELGDEPDSRYTSDPRWSGVVKAARQALDTMNRTDRG